MGYDISFPQCGGALPAQPYAFGIVGATGGRAFTHNPCLRAQYNWAAASGRPPSVYINTKFPSGTTIGQRDTGPAGTCAATDTRCQAYNYGYKTAQDAVAYAKTQGVLDVATWWLDVETENTWSDDKAMNAVVLEAAIDYLKTMSASIGIYSTTYQWSTIAGTYSPGLPVWVAGATDVTHAHQLCATGSFGGGEVQLVQYPAPPFSKNLVCGAAPSPTATPTPASTATATTTAAATPGATATATETSTVQALTGGTVPADGGFGLAVYRGGAVDDLVTSTGCPVETMVLYFTVNGSFVTFIPGTSVAAVNASFLLTFPGGSLPERTGFLGKCV
ncbi:MAG: hypothetical protein R3B59_02890 [Dehalococcoidia bacterium]